MFCASQRLLAPAQVAVDALDVGGRKEGAECREVATAICRDDGFGKGTCRSLLALVASLNVDKGSSRLWRLRPRHP